MIPRQAIADATPSEELALVAALARSLENAGIRCCQWKGHWKPRRRPLTCGDIDLLVRPADVQRLSAVVWETGFRMARPDARQYAGTFSFYAPMGTQGGLLHLHVHYRLYVGHWSNPRRLPIDEIVLASAERTAGLPVPAPELEILLRVCGWASEWHWRPEPIREREQHAADVSAELEYLTARVSLAKVHEAVATHLPFVDIDAFDQCLQAMASGIPDGGLTGRALRRQLASLDSRVRPLTALNRAWRVVTRTVPSFRSRTGRTLLCGGRIVAFVGGDGSGKSTAVNHTRQWLTTKFDTAAFHLGRPPRSVTTLGVGLLRRVAAALGLAAAAPRGSLTILRMVCTARDRYRLHRKIRSRAGRGTIVLCDRYPLSGLGPDGPAFGRSLPLPASGLTRLLYRIESYYYRRILPPDVMIFLDVDPDVAAQRKREEAPDYVRARTADMRRPTAWTRDPRLRVIDADRAVEEVLADVRRCVWATL